MRIGIIQGTTQVSKNELLHNTVVKAVEKKGYDVFNFGVYPNEKQSYSYTEIAFLTALLINSKAIDFVITGCSSGQGMNLACNTLPGLLSGFIQNPQDAYLFGRINDGNVASLSLGLGFGWLGELNLEYTLEKLFDGEFGIGYPADVAERKVRETHRVKEFNKMSKISMIELMKNMDRDFIDKIMTKKNVIHYIIENSNEVELVDYLIKEIS
ncbi:RpiB/LacA/LacB family sugar-phosphate isomerase [Lactococcus muris]|uniref:RpiB/LacA/LacB family sugar-phosphate isomerase n=1 Tax=Lactococcus muris TaxID=2941330 RepID=A0ABV4D8K9_9LACT|nr:MULTISPECIES: RpiB/LacA/LacB family sugar-phosphate isomerase [Lactococcus]HAP15282.1 sugar phosphate isomerase [Lactococcus sp.]